MDREIIARIDLHVLQPSRELFDELDRSIRPQRGPSLLPSRVLLAGLVYLGMVGSTKTVSKLERVLRNEATPGQLQLLMGAAVGPIHQHRSVEPPSRWRLYRLYEALAQGFKREGLGREIFGDEELDTALRKLSRRLLDDSAPPPPPRAEFTVDTTDIRAACRPVSQLKIGLGQLASDPDARWRRKGKGELDPDAPYLKTRSEKEKVGEAKLVFGYGGVTVGGTHQNYGYVYGFDLIPANKHDVSVSLKILDELLAAGHHIAELIGDRGFSSGAAWLNGVRSLGTMPIFDFKEGQGDRDPIWRGCLVLQGWPYLPQLPKRLWALRRPGLLAPADKWKEFHEAVAERALYALLPHGKPTPTSARVESPLVRKRRLGCPLVPGSMRKRDPRLMPCTGQHGSDEACCIKSATFKTKFAPLAYQYPIWGTPEWEKKYAKRTNVERGFSTLKNPDVIGLAPGLFRIRRLVKVSMLAACMFVAHNLHLRMVDEHRQAKGWPRLRRTTSRRRRPLSRPGLVTQLVSHPPAQASRAP